MTAKLSRRMRQQDPSSRRAARESRADPMGPTMRPIIATIPDLRLA